MRVARLIVVVALCALAGPLPAVVRAQPAALALGLTVNDATLGPGDTLTVGVTVDNPGGGPAADFVFVLLLPDGATLVSAGPGLGVRFGRLGDLRSVVPVARNVSLGAAFPYRNDAFFQHRFTGIEPLGAYRLFFAAFRAGALNDGAIGGGDLLALASQDVAVTATSGGPVVDHTRQVTATVGLAGGTLQTTSVDGAGFSLAIAPHVVAAPTAISMAPLTAFDEAPGGPLVAGVRASPSGMTFRSPATLTITLPPGFQPPPFGLQGFVVDDSGGNVEFVPATISGNVVTMRVAHFSVAGVSLDANWLRVCSATDLSAEHLAACVALQPLHEAELARLAAEGGPLSPAFTAAVLPILQAWAQSGVQPRMLDVQIPGPDLLRATDLLTEWAGWLALYETLHGSVLDRTNAAAGRPLGALIDAIQADARLAVIGGMNAANIRCLADKPRVREYARAIQILHTHWDLAFWSNPNPVAPIDLAYCVDVRIDAAPPPVLVPGQSAVMPIDLRVRFTDGVDVPGLPLAVTNSATSASITPPGGIVTSPLSANLTLTPSGTTSVVTISAGIGGPFNDPLSLIPIRTRTFQAGASAATGAASTTLRAVDHFGTVLYSDQAPNVAGGLIERMVTTEWWDVMAKRTVDGENVFRVEARVDRRPFLLSLTREDLLAEAEIQFDVPTAASYAIAGSYELLRREGPGTSSVLLSVSDPANPVRIDQFLPAGETFKGDSIGVTVTLAAGRHSVFVRASQSFGPATPLRRDHLARALLTVTKVPQ